MMSQILNCPVNATKGSDGLFSPTVLDGDTFDVLVLIIDRHGRFMRNMTPACWRKSSLPSKYVQASAGDYLVGGFELYRQVTFDEDMNHQVHVTGARDAVRVKCTIGTLKSELRNYVRSPVVYVSLVNAVILQNSGGPSFSMRLCNGVKLDSKVLDLIYNGPRYQVPSAQTLRNSSLYAARCKACSSGLTEFGCVNTECDLFCEPLIRDMQPPDLLDDDFEELLSGEHIPLLSDGPKRCVCGAMAQFPATRDYHSVMKYYMDEHQLIGAPKFDWKSHVSLVRSSVNGALLYGVKKDVIRHDLVNILADLVKVREMEPQSKVVASMFGLNRAESALGAVEDAVPDVRAAFVAMGAAATRIGSATERTASQVDAFSAKMDGLGNWLSDFANGGYTEILSELLSFTADAMSGAYAHGTSGAFVRVLLRTFNVFKVSAVVAQGFLALFKSGVEYVGQFLSNEPNQGDSVRNIGTAQAGIQARSLPTLVTALVGTLMTGSLPSKDGMKYVGDMLRTFNYAIPAAGHLGDLVDYFVEMLPNAVRNWMCYLCPSERLFVELGVNSVCKQWLKDVDEATMEPELLLSDVEVQNKVLALDVRGRKLIVDMATTVAKEFPDSKLFHLLNRYLVRLEKAKKLVLAVRGASGQRVTPYCVYLYGSPGVGKSSFARFLVNAVCPTGLASDMKVYARNSTAKFWDGYKRQFAVLCDDFHQSILATDVEEMIQVLSNNTFFPEFASLDDPNVGIKGTAMNSKLVLLLSNESHPDTSTSIRTGEAFMRRRQMVIKMIPRVGCVLNPGESDPMKWRLRDESRDSDNWSHVDFQLMDPLRAQGATLKLTVEELLVYFMKDYAKHMQREEKMMGALSRDNIVDRVRREYEQREMEVQMLPAVGVERVVREVAEGLVVLGDCVNPKLTRGFDTMLKDIGVDTPETAGDFLTRVTGTRVGVRSRVSSIPGLQEDQWFDAVSEVENQRVTWLQSHPRAAFWLKVVGVLGSIGGFLWWFLRNRNCGVAESSPERVKFKRGVAAKRVFVAESGKSIPLAHRWVQKLAAASNDFEAKPLIDRLECCRENVDTYNAALLAGEVPSQAWIDRMEGAFEDMHRALRCVVPQWPVTKTNMEFPEADIGEAEGNADAQAISLESSTFVPAMVRIQDESGMVVCGMMVRGSIGLFPRHFFSTYLKQYRDEGSLFSVTTADNEVCKFVRFDKERYVELKSLRGGVKDVCLYNFGPEIRAYKDIVDHFVREVDIRKYSNFAGDLITFPLGRPHPTLRYCAKIIPLGYVGHYVDHEKTDYYMHEGWEYKIPTAPGDCGSILVVHNSGLQRKLVGVHVSGVPNACDGFSELVTYEQLKVALGKWPNVVVGQPIPPGLDSLLLARPKELFVQSSLTLLGTIPDYVCPRGSSKTQIDPSPLFDRVFQHECEPAPLAPGDPRIDESVRFESMLAKGVLAFGKDVPPPRLDYARKAIEYVSRKVRAVLRKEPRFVCSEMEAINGKPEFSHCGSLEMASSPGYPYVLLRPLGTKGKGFLFGGDDGERVIVNEELRRRVDDREEKSKRLERPQSFWQAQLKDELRPLAKIAVGKTRVFVSANVDLTIVCRKYMLAFSSAMFRHCLDKDFFFAPGIDCFSYDWTVMMDGLRTVSVDGCAGDFGKYDTSLNAVFMDAICDIANDWFDDDESFVDTEENKNVRRTLFHEFIHTMILVGNTVLVKHHGNGSGNPLTTLINTIYNEIGHAYVYLLVAPEDQRDLAFYDANVRNKSYGDDVITAIRANIQPWFNMVSISEGFASLGMEYTDAGKTGAELVAIRPLDELTFLKCGFRRYGKMWFPLLSKVSIQELTNWVSNTGDPWLMCKENCTDAVKFAFFHGETYFGDVKRKIERAALNDGVLFSLPDEEYYARIFAHRGKMPSLAYHGCGTLGVAEEMKWGARPMCVQSGQANPDPSLSDEKLVVADHVGVTTVEQSDTVMVTRPGETMMDVRAMAAMNDYRWSMEELVGRPTLVSTIDWLTTLARGMPLLTYLVPGDLIVDNSVTHTPFLLYADWRGDIEVQISVTGTKFVAGMLIAYFAPLTYLSDVAQRFYGNESGQTSVPHVLIDPSVDTTAILKIPYVSIRNFIKLREPSTFDLLGTLTVAPLNILRVGAGQPTAVSVSVTVRFTNCTFANPVPTELSRTYMNERKYDERRRYLVDQLKDLDQKQGPVREMQIQGAGVSKITNNYNLHKSVMKVLGNNTATTELDQKAEARDNNVSIPTLDYPNIGLSPEPIVRSAMGNFANTTQIDHNEMLNLKPGACNHATPETFGSTQDEMSFDYLKQIQNIDGMVSPYAWSTTNGAGSLLAWQYMCPLSPSLQNMYRLHTGVTMTTVDWITARFSFWQGDLRVRFQIVASQFHTGKLFLSLMYGVATTPTAMTLAQVTAGRGVYFSLNNLEHDFEVVLSWNSITDVLRTPRGPNFSDGVTPLTPDLLLEYCMGTWSLWVVEPLRAAPGTPTVVDINLWRSAGENYQVYHLGSKNNTIVPYQASLTKPKEMDIQSGMGELNMAPKVSNPLDPFGESINHVGDVVKRRVMVAVLDNNTVNTQGIKGMFMVDIGRILFNEPADNTGAATTQYTYNGESGMIRWFGSGYRGYRGSVRFRVQYNPTLQSYPGGSNYGSDTPIGAMYVGWDTFSFFTGGSDMTSMTPGFKNLVLATTKPGLVPGVSNVVCPALPGTWSDPGANYVSVEVPYISLYKFLILVNNNATEGNSNYNSVGSLIVSLQGAEPVANSGNAQIQVSAGRAYVWASGGDDFRFGIYMGPPLFALLPSNVGDDTYGA